MTSGLSSATLADVVQGLLGLAFGEWGFLGVSDSLYLIATGLLGGLNLPESLSAVPVFFWRGPAPPRDPVRGAARSPSRGLAPAGAPLP